MSTFVVPTLASTSKSSIDHGKASWLENLSETRRSLSDLQDDAKFSSDLFSRDGGAFQGMDSNLPIRHDLLCNQTSQWPNRGLLICIAAWRMLTAFIEVNMCYIVSRIVHQYICVLRLAQGPRGQNVIDKW